MELPKPYKGGQAKIHCPHQICQTITAAGGANGGGTSNLPLVLVTPKTPELYYCRECDKMYIWINNVLNVLPRSLCPSSIMTSDTKMANTQVVKPAAKKPPISQSSGSGGQSNDTTQSTATESKGGIQE